MRTRKVHGEHHSKINITIQLLKSYLLVSFSSVTAEPVVILNKPHPHHPSIRLCSCYNTIFVFDSFSYVTKVAILYFYFVLLYSMCTWLESVVQFAIQKLIKILYLNVYSTTNQDI